MHAFTLLRILELLEYRISDNTVEIENDKIQSLKKMFS
jgi:hypothetical protein